MRSVLYLTYAKIDLSNAEINLLQALLAKSLVTLSVTYIEEQYGLDANDAWHLCKAVQRLNK